MKLTRKILASVLALALVLMMLPAAFAAEDNTYVLDTTADLTAFAQGDKADGDTEVVNDYFTIHYSAKTKVDSSKKTFADGYNGTQRLSFGGKTAISADTVKNAVEFTTTGPATVTIWWVQGGEAGDTRQVGIYDLDGNIVTQSEVADGEYAKNDPVVSTLEITEAGTYYVGNVVNQNPLFKIEVVETGVAAEPLEIGVNTSNEDKTYTYTAPENGTLTLNVNHASIFTHPSNVAEASYSVNGADFIAMTKGTDEEIILNAGDVVTIEVIAVGGVKLTAAWVADVPGPDLSDAIALVPGTTQNIAANCLLSYTAPAYGVLVLTPAVGMGEATDIIDVAYSINGGSQDYLMSNAENSIELNEGDVLLLDVTVQVSWEPHTISSEWFEGGLPVDLVLGDNAIAGEDIYFTYTATGSGALELGLVLGSTSSLRDQLSLSYSINGGESVVLVSGRPSAVTEVIHLTKGDELLITVKTNITATLTAAWSVLPTPLQTTGWHTLKKETVTFTYTAETNGTLTLTMKIMGIPFNVYANGSYTINGGETVTLPKDQDVAIAMNQGDQILITVETNANNTRLTATWAGEKPACQHTNTKVEGAEEATCTKPGFTGNTVCADCGEQITAGTEIAVLPHTFAEGKCTVCGAADPNYVEPTCQHTNTKVEGAVEATCEDKGYTGDTVCTDCGETVTKGTEIAALGHNYVDGICTNCNNPKTFDVFGIMVAVMAASGTALVVLKKKED